MQVPHRRSEEHKKYQRPSDVDTYLTAAAIARLKDDLVRSEKERPKAAEDVARYKEMGDLSENAAYQEAKFQLRRINSRIESIKERLKRAVVIDEDAGAGGVVRVGATVTIRMNGQEKTYQLVGSQEADPARGAARDTNAALHAKSTAAIPTPPAAASPTSPRSVSC